MFDVGDALKQSEINGIISLYCLLHVNTVNFDYTDEIIETPYCNLQILNGIYSDEELIVEDKLKVAVTNPMNEYCNFYLKLKYYDYDADEDPSNTPTLKEDTFLIENNEIQFGKMVYIMITDWKLIIRYNKSTIDYSGIEHIT